MKTQTPVNAETIMVLPINKEKLNADITKSLQKDKKNAGINFEIRGKFSLLASKPTVLVDDECCSQEVDGNTTFEFDVYKAKVVTKKEGNSETFSVVLFPSYQVEITQKDLLKFCDKEMNLKTFMADRYRYNSRISGNEQEFIEITFGVKIEIPEPAYQRGRR